MSRECVGDGLTCRETAYDPHKWCAVILYLIANVQNCSFIGRGDKGGSLKVVKTKTLRKSRWSLRCNCVLLLVRRSPKGVRDILRTARLMVLTSFVSPSCDQRIQRHLLVAGQALPSYLVTTHASTVTKRRAMRLQVRAFYWHLEACICGPHMQQSWMLKPSL